MSAPLLASVAPRRLTNGRYDANIENMTATRARASYSYAYRYYYATNTGRGSGRLRA